MDLMVTTDRLGGLAMADGDTRQTLAHNLILMAYKQKNKQRNYLLTLFDILCYKGFQFQQKGSKFKLK